MKIKDLTPEETGLSKLLLIILQKLESMSVSGTAYYDNADLKQLFHISDRTIYRLRCSRQIPFFKFGGKYFYPKSFFDKAIV